MRMSPLYPYVGNSFFRPVVTMAMASTLDTLSLAKLVELADKIVEVAVPTVTTVQNQRSGTSPI